MARYTFTSTTMKGRVVDMEYSSMSWMITEKSNKGVIEGYKRIWVTSS